MTAVTRDAKAVDSHFAACGIPLRHILFGGYTDMGSIWGMGRMLKECAKGTIVHVHRYCDAFTVLAAKRLVGRPDVLVVATCHTVAPGRDTWLFRRLYNKINAHIFVSQTAKDTFLSTWRDNRVPIPADRMYMLHDSVNLDDVKPSAEPPRGPVTALCHGTIVEGKGLENVIDALSLLTRRGVKLRLRIAGYGDPDYIDDLRRRAITRGVMDKIDWIIPPGDVLLLIGESHFGVQPSVRREAFGLESLRYMACGRPQVCVPNGAQSEYLTDGVTAIFAPPNDSSRLADAMQRLAEDPQLRLEMGNASRQRYEENQDWNKFIEELDRIYSKFVDDKQ